ncbi:hypothetical protein [Burkholderia pseudomultivorans]|uniref:Uncharacterized protein n=1 Tax=Burkholderia pseudomultivorans TaxID=1207504 RepID=A0A132EML9_9BURK|nr:hypothetical protein [Burkholderia pseudomultivorans]KWF37414.1 hypothetical protein WT56_34305 [Burkholderia pseudomultivorans]
MTVLIEEKNDVHHDDIRQPIKIPRRDWMRLPENHRDVQNEQLYVLSSVSRRPAFVRAVLI